MTAVAPMRAIYAHDHLKRSFLDIGLELGITHERVRQVI